MFLSSSMNHHFRHITLCLLLFFHGSSTCGWHKGSWFNRPRRDVKESLDDYDRRSINSIRSHTLITDEPIVKIEANILAALDRLRQVLSQGGHEKEGIDPKVVEYFSERRDFWLRSPFSQRNVSSGIIETPRGACSIVRRDETPRPLHRDENDLSHFLIDIPDFRQQVEAYKCTNVGQSCGLNYYVTQPKLKRGGCKQILRYVKVLVLPSAKQYFNINDFKVATYGIDDGCLCVRPQKALY